jgi:Tol biopolymer transport system component
VVAFGNVSSAIGKHRLEFGARGSVRTELARLQKQTGLSLVLIDNRTIQVLILSPRPQAKEIKLPDGGEGGEISPEGTTIAFRLSRGIGSHLAISRIDGTDLREFPDVETVTGGMCWSNDKSRLALRATILQKTGDLESELAARERRRPSLVIVDTRSGETTEVDGQGSVSSQCWSQDDKQLVYEAGGDIRLYDVKGNRSRVLVRGTHASWSPDGNRIAFLQDDGYYATGPSGTEKQLLFKKFHPQSGLSWSPDSRFVAFVSQSKFFECGFALDVETYCLRVRRLQDNSEWKVSESGAECGCQWVTNQQLARNTASISDRAGALAQKHNIRPEVP